MTEVAKPKAEVPVAIPASAVTTAAGDSVKERVLALVAEKTGYPVDMLDFDLDLEADLGVDTVKQAEVFATIRQAYGIPRDENVKLREYPTLAHVIRFVNERRSDLPKGAPAKEEIKPVLAAPAAKEEVATVPSAPADCKGAPGRRRIPSKSASSRWWSRRPAIRRDMLDLDLDLEADLGVDTVKQAEMFAAIREIYNIPRDENRKLRDYPTLAHVIRFVYEKRPDFAGTTFAAEADVTRLAAAPSPAA